MALNRAGNRALDADAKDFLAQHLFELYTLADWPFLYVSAPLTVSSAVVDLPDDFVTPQDDHAMQILAIDGTPQANAFVTEVAPEQVAVYAGVGTMTGGVPEVWAVSRADTTATFAPDPGGRRIDVLLRYKRLPPEPDPTLEPTDVPVFPYHNYLVQAVFVFALEHERDPRAAQEAATRDNLLGLIRRGASPVRSQRADIPLDPLVFRAPFRGD